MVVMTMRTNDHSAVGFDDVSTVVVPVARVSNATPS
jgi:hypothetical protein